MMGFVNAVLLFFVHCARRQNEAGEHREKINIYRVLVRKSGEKGPLVRPGHKWKNSVKLSSVIFR
jgi:hypothetical protein